MTLTWPIVLGFWALALGLCAVAARLTKTPMWLWWALFIVVVVVVFLARYQR